MTMALIRVSAALLLLVVVVHARASREEAPVATAGGAEESRTIQQPITCRPGLCPHIKRLLPDAYSHHHLHHSRDDDPPPSLCGNLCFSDLECPLGKKCCPTNCGYACYDAVIVAPLV